MQSQLKNKYDDYMLTGKTLISALKYNRDNNSNNNQKNEKSNGNNKLVEKNAKPSKETSFFIPQEKDGLFWCFYVIKNGFAAYEYPGATSFVNEKSEKFKLIESLRTKKQVLKTKKIVKILIVTEELYLI